MKRFTVLLLSMVVVGGTMAISFSQPLQRRGDNRQKTLQEPFRGVTTDGKPIADLFPVKSTGVSTQPIVVAAKAFLNSLSEAEQESVNYPVDHIEWRKWDNRHRYPRAGIGFKKMSKQQRKRAFNLFKESLSAKGLKKTQDIMKLNGTLAELTNRFDEYGEWLYWVTIMGKPSKTEPWGWQLDGHHVVINYFVMGDQVVMSPVFMGSEPVEAEGGKFKGTIVMQDEEAKGLRLMQSLSDAQQKEATIQSEKGGTNNLAEAFNDNLVLDYAGIEVSKFKPAQQKLFFELVEEYIGNMRSDHAPVRMAEIKEHLNETYFAWIGEAKSDSVFYYRIQSPVILIEFDHQRPVALSRSREATRAHIHTVVRTPNGNDYGKDLLRQHYKKHHHGN